MWERRPQQNQRTSRKKGELNSGWHLTQPNLLLPLPEVVITDPAPKIRWKPELFLYIKTDFINSNLQRIEEQGIKISARQVLLAPPMPLCLPSSSLCSDTDQWLLKTSCPEMASRLRQWGTQGDGRKERKWYFVTWCVPWLEATNPLKPLPCHSL